MSSPSFLKGHRKARSLIKGPIISKWTSTTSSWSNRVFQVISTVLFKIHENMKSNVPDLVLFGLPAPDALVFWKDPDPQKSTVEPTYINFLYKTARFTMGTDKSLWNLTKMLIFTPLAATFTQPWKLISNPGTGAQKLGNRTWGPGPKNDSTGSGTLLESKRNEFCCL